MKKLSLVFIALCLFGCVPLGQQYQYQNAPRLKLGELKSDEYVSLFGKPKKTSIQQNADGKYEVAQYYFGQIGFFGDISQRQLYLEFKDGKLNAYHLFSDFKADKTNLDSTQLSQIVVNSSTKDDVVNLLGESTGRGLCPTTIYDLKEECDKGNEIWTWHKGVNGKYSILYVIFNPDSTVASFHLSEDK